MRARCGSLIVVALALAGCPGPGDDDECAELWQTVHDDTDGVLLSVQGSAADDMWLAGGGLELGFATLRRFDGTSWTTFDLAGDDRTLWWVTPDGEGGAWAVGERGAVVHVDASGAVTRHDVDTTATFYGAFVVAPGDVWVVGAEDTVLRWNGADFIPQPPPTSPGTTLYKVWAADAQNVWVVGARGTVLLWDGNDWVDHSLADPVRVLTVHGCSAGSVYAVGGQHLYEWTGSTWQDAAPAYTFPTTLNGVNCSSLGVSVVGNAGYRALIADELVDEHTLDGAWDTDYHSVWRTDGSERWAAGGSFNAPAPADRRGVLSATVPCPEGPPDF